MQTTYDSIPVGRLDADSRATFIARTYRYLMAAIAGFVIIEVLLFTSGWAEGIAETMLSRSWLLVLGAFVIVSYGASTIAHKAVNHNLQLLALGGMVVAQAIIFVPLLWSANEYAPGAISSAAVVATLGFAGLTLIVFQTRRDFSFLAPFLRWMGLAAILLIVGSLVFGFELGTVFSVAMIAFAGGAILHTTSTVLRVYPEDRYVAASLELFSSVALMFWYILRLFISLRD